MVRFTDTTPNQKVLGIKELLFWVGGERTQKMNKKNWGKWETEAG